MKFSLFLYAFCIHVMVHHLMVHQIPCDTFSALGRGNFHVLALLTH